MTFDTLRPTVSKLLEPLVRLTADAGISPNIVSMISLLFALLAGLMYYYSAFEPVLVLAAGLMVAINSLLDAMDGLMARYLDSASIRGDFLDHVIDRYSDVFIICGIFFGGYVDWRIGVMTIVGVLLTSYLGTQAQALKLGRYYGGVIGRADRLVLIIASSFLYYAYQGAIYGFSVIEWMMIIIGIGSHITALQRIAYIWKRL